MIEVPKEIDISDADKLSFVTQQMLEMGKIVYRNLVDSRIAESYKASDDDAMRLEGKTKAQEYEESAKKMILNIQALAEIRDELREAMGVTEARKVEIEIENGYNRQVR